MQFFVHIPKTAGTSFRKAAEAYLGRDSVAYDYGPKSIITSGTVKQHLYAPQVEDRPALYEAWRNERIGLVSGHMPVARFVDLTGVGGVITFLREPLKRAFSEFLHVRRNEHYRWSFRDFFMSQRPNHQTHMLSGVPFQALGFVGTTERYEESLSLINHHLGWSLRKRQDNKAGLIQTWLGKVSPDETRDFYQRNPLDLDLFRQANWWLDQRLKAFEAGRPFVHAAVDRVTGDAVSGWAFWASGPDKPVVVEVHMDGVKVAEAVADQEHPQLARYGAPRGGMVGFKTAIELEPDSTISVVIAQTGQAIALPAECRL